MAEPRADPPLAPPDRGIWRAAEIVAFAIADGGSRRIAVSQVLPGLALSVLEEALGLAREQDDSQVTSWLMGQFQL